VLSGSFFWVECNVVRPSYENAGADVARTISKDHRKLIGAATAVAACIVDNPMPTAISAYCLLLCTTMTYCFTAVNIDQ